MKSDMESENEVLKAKLKQQQMTYERRLMLDQASVCELLYNILGKEKFEEEYLAMRRKQLMDWSSRIAKKDLKRGKMNNIQGIIDFIWEPLKDMDFKFFFKKKEKDFVEIRVTKCPLADWAKAKGIEKWIYYYHCMSDPAIVEGYNPKIGFKRSKVIMQGDGYCDHCYFIK